MSRKHAIPTFEQVIWEYPPIPNPLYVAIHPDSDDGWTMTGHGQTKLDAYANLLVNLAEYEDLRD